MAIKTQIRFRRQTFDILISFDPSATRRLLQIHRKCYRAGFLNIRINLSTCQLWLVSHNITQPNPAHSIILFYISWFPVSIIVNIIIVSLRRRDSGSLLQKLLFLVVRHSFDQYCRFNVSLYKRTYSSVMCPCLCVSDSVLHTIRTSCLHAPKHGCCLELDLQRRCGGVRVCQKNSRMK